MQLVVRRGIWYAKGKIHGIDRTGVTAYSGIQAECRHLNEVNSALSRALIRIALTGQDPAATIARDALLANDMASDADIQRAGLEDEEDEC